MCRLTAYIGPPITPSHLVTRPNRSIIRQSYSARERVTERGYLNGDGFGLGWYPLVPTLDDGPATAAVEDGVCSDEQKQPQPQRRQQQQRQRRQRQQERASRRSRTERSSCSALPSSQQDKHDNDSNSSSTQQQTDQQQVQETAKGPLQDTMAARGDGAACRHQTATCTVSAEEKLRRENQHFHGPEIPPPNAETLSGSCFQRAEPCVFTGTGPAWNSGNLRQLSDSISASIVFAHVRAATEGTDVTELSCHPFHFGRYMFMHNGNIGDFEHVRRHILPTLEGAAFDFAVARGSSDSALCFAMFLNKLQPNVSTPLSCEQIRATLVTVITDLEEVADRHGLRQASMLNFVLTDGEHTVCTRYLRDPDSTQTGAATLYFSAGAGYECVDEAKGVYRMSHADRRHRVVIVASEPLTNTTSDWLPVPPNYAITISREIDVLLGPIHGEQPSCHPSVTDCLQRASVPDSAQAVYSSDLSSMAAGYHDITHSANVLCFEIVGSLVFSGTNSNAIAVWDSDTWTHLAELKGHEDAVLSLTSTVPDTRNTSDNSTPGGGEDADKTATKPTSPLAAGQPVLFSASSDSTIRSWTAGPPFAPLMIISFLGMGDATTLAVLGNTLFAGFQDTKIRALPVDAMLHPLDDVARADVSTEDVAMDTLKQYALDDFRQEDFSQSDSNVALPTAPRRPKTSPQYVVRDASGRMQLASKQMRKGGPLAKNGKDGDNNGAWTPDECHPTMFRVMGVHATVLKGLRELGVDTRRHTSHFSIVHSIVLCGDTLVSGAGDGLLKLWDTSSLECVGTLSAHFSSVQVLVAWQAKRRVFSGSRDCTVRAWDVDNRCSTGMCTHFPSEVLSLVLFESFLFCGLDDNSIHLLSPSTLMPVHVLGCGSPAPVQCMLLDSDRHRLYTGVGVDMRIWTLPRDLASAGDGGRANLQTLKKNRQSCSEAHLREMLQEFVGFKSVSSDERLKSECYDAAEFLLQVLKDHGCNAAQVLETQDGKSPLVLGRMWTGNDRPTMLIYGHYDVMPAEEAEWDSDPFTLAARNGYWYGRGATDDKGPILATILAAGDLLSRGQLDVNLIFIYEGEAENHSGGFQEALDRIAKTPRLAATWHPKIDYIFISNNYWIDDQRPCLTYAMRGHIRMTATVRGPRHNLHAGVDGGAVVEPTIDLCHILGTLADGSGRVCVPGFLDGVRPADLHDDEALDRIDFDADRYKRELGVQRLAQTAEQSPLRARWAEPTLSITDITTSNGDQAFSIIPNMAKAQISIRFVPDQEAQGIVDAVQQHLHHEFSKRNSGNKLSVDVVQVSEWWRSETSSPYFEAARKATQSVWGKDPLLVCEGGTMHTTCMLVKHFGAPALHLPMGQSSDSAHLPNERIRIQNLVNGQAVVFSFLEHLSKMQPTTSTTKKTTITANRAVAEARG